MVAEQPLRYRKLVDLVQDWFETRPSWKFEDQPAASSSPGALTPFDGRLFFDAP